MRFGEGRDEDGLDSGGERVRRGDRRRSIMSSADPGRMRLIELYRKRAKHYDLVSRLSPVPGYPQQALRVRAIRALGLRRGDTVVDVACGTGLNFPLIEKAIGPTGRIVGVDLTDAMLARAASRVSAGAWSNVDLVQADAAAFVFPAGVDAVLSTYALTQVPECAAVIAHASAALADAGRCVVLDLKIPERTPKWMLRLGVAAVGSAARLDEWSARRPWESIRAAVEQELVDPCWTELCFGTAFLAAGGAPVRAIDR
jgi:demethylmenaquinone methyltransferase/2-methoxy-6-polyprenyl-1,4-benzoquinol methylase